MKQFYMPVKVLIGENCIKENQELFAGMGKKAMIVTGRHSAKVCGALDDVTEALQASGQTYVLYDRVMNNPSVDCVYEGGRVAREEQVDFIVAIGGGSPMDAAKAMAMLAVCDIPKEKIFDGVAAYPALPMIHVPTTAGTGSEVTPYAILTNPGRETKTSISASSLFPRYALLDPAYLQQLPEHSLIHTVIDSLSHSMEGMLSVRASEITDSIAVHAIALIGECLPRLKDNELSQEDREKLLVASTMGGMVISATGTTVVHSMGYSLTFFHGTDHGRANGLLLPEFLKIARQSHPERVKKMLQPLRLASLDQFAEQLHDLLGQHETLTVEEIEKYTALASGSKNIKNCCVPVTPEQIREIFTKSLGQAESGR